jgi:hypothetical protein
MITREDMRATVADREREIRQLHATQEARRVGEPPVRERRGGWAWRVEPGMGEVFGSLRGWLLSREGGSTAKYLPSAE